MKTILIIFFSWLLTKYALVGDEVKAGGESAGNLPNPLHVTNIADLINKIAGYLMAIAVPITTIMVIVGAFQMLTSGGNPEKFKTGQKTILYAAVGFAIVLISKGITAIVKEVLGAK